MCGYDVDNVKRAIMMSIGGAKRLFLIESTGIVLSNGHAFDSVDIVILTVSWPWSQRMWKKRRKLIVVSACFHPLFFFI
jgi:hypothetical protein